jgi:hypothetical protein
MGHPPDPEQKRFPELPQTRGMRIFRFVSRPCPYNSKASIQQEYESLAMFEQLDEPEKAPKVSVGMSLGILGAYLLGAFGGFCLFISLGERPFGLQIATAITYTYFAFWYIFFPTRGLLEKYSLRNKTVQQQIPPLLAIHCALLILIFIGQTIWFAKAHPLGYRLTEHEKPGGTSYAWAMIGPVAVFFFTQVLISRRIVSRSLREDLNKSGSVLDGPRS